MSTYSYYSTCSSPSGSSVAFLSPNDPLYPGDGPTELASAVPASPINHNHHNFNQKPLVDYEADIHHMNPVGSSISSSNSAVSLTSLTTYPVAVYDSKIHIDTRDSNISSLDNNDSLTVKYVFREIQSLPSQRFYGRLKSLIWYPIYLQKEHFLKLRQIKYVAQHPEEILRYPNKPHKLGLVKSRFLKFLYGEDTVYYTTKLDPYAVDDDSNNNANHNSNNQNSKNQESYSGFSVDSARSIGSGSTVFPSNSGLDPGNERPPLATGRSAFTLASLNSYDLWLEDLKLSNTNIAYPQSRDIATLQSSLGESSKNANHSTRSILQRPKTRLLTNVNLHNTEKSSSIQPSQSSFSAVVPPTAPYGYMPCIYGMPPTPLYGHTATLLNHEIIIFGGFNGFDYTAELSVLDCESHHLRREKTRGNVPPAMYGTTANKIPGKPQIIYFGGGNSNYISNETWILNVRRGYSFQKVNVSEVKPPARRGHTAVWLRDRLYIYGGLGVEATLGDLWELALTNDQANEISGSWREIKPRNTNDPWPLARSYHSADVVDRVPITSSNDNHYYRHKDNQNNKSNLEKSSLFVSLTSLELSSQSAKYHPKNRPNLASETFSGDASSIPTGMLVHGGYCGSIVYDDVWYFNPLAISDPDTSITKSEVDSPLWVKFPTYQLDPLTQLPVEYCPPRLLHCTICYDKWLCVLGGYDGQQLVSDIWWLCLKTGVWIKKMYYGVLDKGKCHHRCVFYDGRCYSLGGTDLNWETLSEIRVLELPLSERSFRDSETIET